MTSLSSGSLAKGEAKVENQPQLNVRLQLPSLEAMHFQGQSLTHSTALTVSLTPAQPELVLNLASAE